MSKRKPKIDMIQFMETVGIGATNKELAIIFGCSTDYLEHNLAKEMALGREDLKTRLRKKQLEVAMAGNVTMLIWLGKNILKQTDAPPADLKDDQNANLGQQTLVEELAKLINKTESRS